MKPGDSSTSRDVLNLLHARGLSQRDIARIAGVSQPEISRTRSGRRDLTVEQLERLAAHLEVPLWRLLLRADRAGVRDKNDRADRREQVTFQIKEPTS